MHRLPTRNTDLNTGMLHFHQPTPYGHREIARVGSHVFISSERKKMEKKEERRGEAGASSRRHKVYTCRFLSICSPLFFAGDSPPSPSNFAESRENGNAIPYMYVKSIWTDRFSPISAKYFPFLFGKNSLQKFKSLVLFFSTQ